MGRPPLFGEPLSGAARARRYRARQRGAEEPALVIFRRITMTEANAMLARWEHRMGPVQRAMNGRAHGLFVATELVAVTTTHTTVMPRVAGMDRAECLELSRLAAAGPQWCRVALRLWREVVLPASGRSWGISYSDNAIHGGGLYRFDGWTVLGRSRSGTDTRSGRPGRDKTIWGWSCTAGGIR